MLKNKFFNGIVGAVLLISFNLAYAQSAEERGLEIALEADARDQGWGDSTANMKMILKNKQGATSVREIRTKTLEVVGDGDKSMIIFDKPRDVRGTVLLTFSYVDKPDDQWLYLPALKRVKRISSRNKSGPFMGSEFAFEDLSSQEVAKYTYKFLAEEACGDGMNCFKMARFPTDEHSGYTKQIIWLDTKEYRPIKIDFYDRRNALLKTLVMSDYQQYLGKYWRAGNMLMTNHQTGKVSELIFSDYQFNTGLKDADFNKSKLSRMR
ncbi:MAG TPA: outer membrane lipoprotein-sorting protein [Thiomicrospira sp.]|jgi:outer membrane lipoprotein-sorting protein|nr:outer membrane lipoprotein-sorting protein [Thiomicrospira sp.]